MLSLFTICLDGMPFIERHLATFEKLAMPWKWTVVEGSSQNIGCTGWCKPQEPRLSRDGTTEYLDSIASHPNVKVLRAKSWPGKLAMINAALATFDTPGTLVEIDSDEIWTTAQLETIVNTFSEHTYAGAMQFDCRYFVGPDIVTVGTNCFGNNRSYEWRRAWRYQPGNLFSRHEPPIFPHGSVMLTNDVTRQLGLVFDHFAYATEAQVRYKEKFYNYPGAVDGWRRLQANTVWPAKLKDFLPFVDDRVQAVRL